MPTYFGLTEYDASSITLMAAGAMGDLTGEGWSYYNAVDAPEGNWNFFGNTDKTATLTLPTSLSVGTWYIFVKMIDYDQHRTWYWTLGSDTSSTITTNDRDANGYWSDKSTLIVTTAGTTLVGHLGNNGGSATSHMLKGIFITNDANVTVLADDIVANMNFPTVMDDSTAIKGNLIPNSGFEAGVDGMQWGFISQGGGRTVPLTGMWDNTQGWEGAACLKVLMDSATRLNPSNTTDPIVHRVKHLKPNKTYTFSCYLKASSGHSFTGSVQAWNTFVPPAGASNPQYHIDGSGATITSAGWTRVSVTGYLKAYTSCDFTFVVNLAGADGTYCLVDGVQLEEGSLSAWAPASNLDAGVLIDQATYAGNVFYPSNSMIGTLKVRNNTGSTENRTLHYVIYDYRNRIVREGTVALSIAANTTYTDSSFSLSTKNLYGSFRLVTWIEEMEHTEREIVFNRIPQPPSGFDTASYMGTHPNFYPFQLAALERIGIKWGRALSPETIGRWSDTHLGADGVEPVDDTFNFYDSKITAILAAHITPMVCLGTNNFWPGWADNSGLPNLTKWAEFCGNHTPSMVQHYSPNVKYWEIWNEPLSSQTPFDAAFYAKMLHDATDAILASDATAKIIAMGGLSATNMQAVIDELASQYPSWNWQAKFTAMATHNYPDGINPATLTTIINTYGVPVWNTETGLWDKGFYQGQNSGFVSWGRNIWPNADAQNYYRGCIRPGEMTRNFVKTIGAGQKNYFYYDSRYYADPQFFDTHTSIWEQDGSIRSKGIALALAGSLIDKSTTLGQVNPDSNSHGWVFDTGGTNPVACLFSVDYAARKITLSGLTSKQIEVFDMMRNPIPFSGVDIPYGRIPTYIRGLGISASQLSSAISGGTVATRTDTEGPNIVIVDAPKGPVASGEPFRIRFVAIDEQSFPNVGEINGETNAPAEAPNPEAIVYAHRLKPYESWSSWTARGFLVDYSGIPDGYYSFLCKAKDAAGNESKVTERRIKVGSSNRPPRVFMKH